MPGEGAAAASTRCSLPRRYAGTAQYGAVVKPANGLLRL